MGCFGAVDPWFVSAAANFPPSGVSAAAKTHFCDAPQPQLHLFCQLEEEGGNSWTANWKRKCSSSSSSSSFSSSPQFFPVFFKIHLLASPQLTGSAPGPAEWLWARAANANAAHAAAAAPPLLMCQRWRRLEGNAAVAPLARVPRGEASTRGEGVNAFRSG